ncbi:MAG: HDOD domain-containing protein [Bryobacteraceae bacterium]|nr:HDOD domain-containing protein [Bryobacteraceae bacterium]
MAIYAPARLDRRQALLRAADSLPPFSPVVNLLLAKLSRQDVRFSEVSELIEKDTVMAGNLLRVANSALYGFAGTINSVRHGLAILGIEKTRNVVLAVSMTRFWSRDPEAEGWSSTAFNLHSTAVAILADLLVQYVPAEYPEGAFTAGLFHDLGKHLAASALPKEFAAVQQDIQRGGARFEEAESFHYGILHPELSAAALERWNLPQPIAEAVRWHHWPRPAGRSGCFSLSQILNVAGACVNSLGYGFAFSAPEVCSSPEEALAPLSLGDRVPRLLDEFRAEVEVLRCFF